MKIINQKKNIHEQVSEILDKQGYILDDQSAKIFGNDKIYRVHEHVRIWQRLQKDKEYFKGKTIVEKTKGHRCHLVRTNDMSENSYVKVGKGFWNSIDLLR